MSESADLILLITICFIILISHVRANYFNKAIVRDIAIVVIYLFIKYIIINL